MVKRVRWDPAKAKANWEKHHVSFEEAQTIFLDEHYVSVFDEPHSDEEDRFFAIGQSSDERLLAVTYTIRDDEPWIITARQPEPMERRRYMRGHQIKDEAALAPVESDKLDWSNAVRGRHYIKPRGPITVQIEPVLAEFFRDEAAVNNALRLVGFSRATIQGIDLFNGPTDAVFADWDMLSFLGPIAVAVHCLFVKGLIFDGTAGLLYTAQRVTADLPPKWFGRPGTGAPLKQIKTARCEIMKLGDDILWVHSSYPYKFV